MIWVCHVFTDEAKTGRSNRRKGLSAPKAAIANDEVDVVICFTSNRLFRKLYRAMQFVEEEIVDRRKRCVFVDQNIDTATPGWRQSLPLFAIMDEQQVAQIAGQVRAAHRGLLLSERVHGTET